MDVDDHLRKYADLSLGQAQQMLCKKHNLLLRISLNGSLLPAICKVYAAGMQSHTIKVNDLWESKKCRCLFGQTCKKELSRRSRNLGIYRRRNNLNAQHLLEVSAAIRKVICEIPNTVGYRGIWLRLKQQYHISVSRNLVMRMIKDIAPVEVASRRLYSLKRREYRVPGPNYVWHMDGYDKLKKFGFAIHGCIDGYSRKLIWLEVGPTNNNSKVIGGFFLRAASKAGGLPRLIRADLGTENVVVEKIQRVLRCHLHQDTLKDVAFIYGRSCMNQRIERFWGSFSSMNIRHVADHLSDLERRGVFSTANIFHIEAVRHCYMEVVRSIIGGFVNLWNHHYIRKSSAGSVAGKPEVLYNLATDDHLQPVAQEFFETATDYVSEVDDIDPDFAQSADILLQNWVPLSDDVTGLDHARERFLILIDAIDDFQRTRIP